MTNIDHISKIIESERTKVELANDERVNLTASRYAYYSAMVRMTEEDPLDDAEENLAVRVHLQSLKLKYLDEYMEAVNDAMP